MSPPRSTFTGGVRTKQLKFIKLVRTAVTALLACTD